MENVLFEVIEQVQNKMANVTVEVRNVSKNNNMSRTGILVMDGSRICPIIYVDHLLSNGATADEITEYVLHAYENCERPDIDATTLTNYETIKNNLRLKLVNKNMNSDLLSKVSYCEFLDMAVIIEVLHSYINGVKASFKVTHNLLELWNKTFDEVYKDAFENLINDLPVFYDIFDIVADVLHKDMSDVPDDSRFIYVLTSKSKIDGAVYILNDKAIRDIADWMNDDVLVLPSSIHETILLPLNHPSVDVQSASEMVRLINETEVDPEEVLSNNAYIYRRATGWEICK